MNKLEYINVGPKGTFEPSGDSNNDTTPQDVDAIINYLKQSNISNITFYIHGGLVKESDGMASAKVMGNVIKQANHHPVAIVWETGFIETLKERITTIHHTTIFKKLLKFVIKRAGGRIGVEVGGKGVRTFTNSEIDSELGKEIPFEDYGFNESQKGFTTQEIENEDYFLDELEIEIEEDFESDPEVYEILKQIDESTLLDKEKLIFNQESQQRKGIFSSAKFIKFVAIICFKVIKRHIKKRDHGFYPTIIEEILRELYIADFGAWVWKGMKDKAKEMWYPNDDQVGLSRHSGTYFLEKLASLSNEQDITLNIIGHSAGSIVACHMLSAIDNRFSNVKLGKVVFLAPACRTDLFYKEILSKPDRYSELRIFTMSDAYEKKDALINSIPKFYPRSLLYFVSGLLEDKGKSYDQFILGMERFINWSSYTSKFDQLNDISKFLNDAGKNRLVLSKSPNDAQEGLRTTAIDHGEFDNDGAVHESIVHYLKH